MNKKNKKDRKNQSEAECGELGRSSKKKGYRRNKVKQALRTRHSGWLSGDEDFEDYIDDSAAHPTKRPKPHNRIEPSDDFDY